MAPKSPGIYAWYARLSAGAADWRRNLDEVQQRDLGEKNLRDLLLLHSQKFDPTPYEVTAKSSFELVWKGDLAPQLAGSLDRILSDEELEELDAKRKKEVQKLRKPLKTEKSRALLVDLISRATPFFSAPIYIGTSDDLRRRLLEHTRSIDRYAEAIAKEPEKRQVLLRHIQTSKSSFAARVTAMEFAPEQLEVFTLDVSELAPGNWTKDDLEAIAAALEWLLNRWHRPIAGRI